LASFPRSHDREDPEDCYLLRPAPAPAAAEADVDRTRSSATSHPLPNNLRSPALARSILRAALADAPTDTVDVAELLVSELVANAVMHAQTRSTLHIEVAGPRLTVSVEDCSSTAPVLRRQAPFDGSIGGRGLLLVDGMADAWGWEPTATGKRVWFTQLNTARRPSCPRSASEHDEALGVAEEAVR
jgi:anti-sigma regulatory factor (Ser/Thr protein kinase)